ncbi:MAG: 50S ribosomal protein L18 [Gammaproteobacteria bacterium]|jgi:large subunit ribosomal protein L18
MNIKQAARFRRAKKCRGRIKRLHMTKLCVHRTPQHIYAQIISPEGKVLVSAVSVEKAFKQKYANTGNIAAAAEIGKLIAERAKARDIVKVAFDRSGFKYHGRIKALADAAREGGLEF